MDSNNHGLDFTGQTPNGLYSLTEVGVTPIFHSMPGKYAFGYVSWRMPDTQRSGSSYKSRYDFYFQCDQMLYRAPASVEKKMASLDWIYSDSDIDHETSHLNNQGLFWFSWLNFAPSYNNKMPLYYQTGTAYKGLIPNRELDQIILGIGYGNYNGYQTSNQGGNSTYTYEGVFEADYRVQVTPWAYLQPYLQYIIHPGGTASTPNATVVGLNTAISF
jgi:porin